MNMQFNKPKRLGMSGKMGSGKSTLSKRLAETSGYKIISIGTSIKKTTSLLIEDPIAQLNYLTSMIGDTKKTQELHSQLMDIYTSKFASSSWEKDSYGNYIKTQSSRELLQDVSTKTREHFGDDIFVKFTANEADILTSQGFSVICDDVRLPEEKKFLENEEFNIIRIDVEKNEQYRRLLENYGKINEDQINHITETALDNEKFHFRIDTTNSTIEDSLNLLKSYLLLSSIKPVTRPRKKN